MVSPAPGRLPHLSANSGHDPLKLHARCYTIEPRRMGIFLSS